jgi:hypothetical protein
MESNTAYTMYIYTPLVMFQGSVLMIQQIYPSLPPDPSPYSLLLYKTNSGSGEGVRFQPKPAQSQLRYMQTKTLAFPAPVQYIH